MNALINDLTEFFTELFHTDVSNLSTEEIEAVALDVIGIVGHYHPEDEQHDFDCEDESEDWTDSFTVVADNNGDILPPEEFKKLMAINDSVMAMDFS